MDLNANVGESFGIWSRGSDDGLWDQITTANIACGFHAGDAPTMRRCVTRAVEAGTRICALVGYRDLAGFGNRFLDVAPADLAAEVVYQLGALDGIALVAGGNVAAVRLAGALGSGANAGQVTALVAALKEYDDKLTLVTDVDAVARRATEAGLPVDREMTAGGAPARAVAALKDGSIATIHVTAKDAADVRRRLTA